VSQPREKPRIVQKLEERREAYEQKGRVYRTMWVTAGVIVTLAGLVLLVTPGPAFVIIPIGLATVCGIAAVVFALRALEIDVPIVPFV
jgi:uncharacterized membrane protein HdeD (DUF308 family)